MVPAARSNATRLPAARMHWPPVPDRLRRPVAALLAGMLAGAAPSARALSDEIRVYTDQIVERGEFELEGHFSTVPRRRGAAADNENGTLRGLVLTPELSYGLGNGWEIEAGFFVPVLRSDDGARWRTRPHARVKWIPRQAPAGGGWFWGAIAEWGLTPRTPAESRSEVDLRPVIGWRDARWLVAANLIIDLPMAREVSRIPSLGPVGKVVRTFDGGWGLGMEYHGDWGRFRRPDADSPRTQVMYLTVNVPEPLDLHLGIGRGLNAASGGWTIKGSVQIPLD